ncbi:hypothetical protein MF672_044970 [Actinomadura sp. ATCC 31491]|uniref:Uncharacterized protein n=1 Tax=Actinomadura luzonensis TaxID=2805427 RepID=A0ABT0G8I9_9ACTN|nr:hypothetical protein [Actinomadura luzonensis]MCK2220913.1 hypothetical protein [Actinomadura luzonensis]
MARRRAGSRGRNGRPDPGQNPAYPDQPTPETPSSPWPDVPSSPSPSPWPNAGHPEAGHPGTRHSATNRHPDSRHPDSRHSEPPGHPAPGHPAPGHPAPGHPAPGHPAPGGAPASGGRPAPGQSGPGQSGTGPYGTGPAGGAQPAAGSPGPGHGGPASGYGPGHGGLTGGYGPGASWDAGTAYGSGAGARPPATPSYDAPSYDAPSHDTTSYDDDLTASAGTGRAGRSRRGRAAEGRRGGGHRAPSAPDTGTHRGPSVPEAGGAHAALAGSADGGWAVIPGPGTGAHDPRAGGAHDGRAGGAHETPSPRTAEGAAAEPAETGRGNRASGLFGRGRRERDAFADHDLADQDGGDFFASDRIAAESAPPPSGAALDDRPSRASRAGGRGTRARRPDDVPADDGVAASRAGEHDDETGETTAGSRKRRRTPPSDWQFPILTGMGLKPRQQRLIVIIASVVGLLGATAGVVAIAMSIGGYSPEREASAALLGPDAALPQVFRGWNSPKLFDPLADRAKDGKALTEKEVFGQSELEVTKKLKLKLVAKKLDADCSAALWGGSLTEQVADAGCTQAARGLYLSSDGRYVGQYTLLNLRDGQSATELVDSLKTLYRGGWARPLTSSKGSFPPGGYSEAGGYALGHYVGLVWLGRVDGAEPGVRDDYVSLTLGLRGAEKAVYRRVVAITGPAS